MSKNIEEEEYREKLLKKDKSLHIGMYIYSLSKLYMYQMTYGQWARNKFVYTDTDSNKCGEQMFQEWKLKIGNLKISDYVWDDVKKTLGYNDQTVFYQDETRVKLLGQFEDEYAGSQYTTGYFVEKKEYLVCNDKKMCCMLKGLDKNNFCLINGSEKLNLKMTIHCKKGMKKISVA